MLGLIEYFENSKLLIGDMSKQKRLLFVHQADILGIGYAFAEIMEIHKINIFFTKLFNRGKKDTKLMLKKQQTTKYKNTNFSLNTSYICVPYDKNSYQNNSKMYNINSILIQHVGNLNQYIGFFTHKDIP